MAGPEGALGAHPWLVLAFSSSSGFVGRRGPELERKGRARAHTFCGCRCATADVSCVRSPRVGVGARQAAAAHCALADCLGRGEQRCVA